ncbi:DEAD/DEAH box helicase family protein [Brevundimonas sp. LF-1]|uniref:DEAD/DEAH box helicase family protein n=1 Tax=Brevundimonas sp. LF-1 TaxID=3126100 RepID=UPI0030E51F0A
MSVSAVDPKRAESQINQRLSLRKPQSESLRRLADIVDLIAPSKDTDVEAAREAIRNAYGDLDDAYFEDFERDFPSVCFALATGVGKTRLMGAFVSYLFMIGKSRNFFVLAPNLTIYEKLLADFQPSSPKYVFKGVESFAHNPPLIVNAENYEEGRGVRGADLLGQEAAIINIFNISKINSDTTSSARKGQLPRIKRLQEYIGESYFSYLAGLDDLVLLMDEAHRYRGSAGAKAIAELKPILGLEVTATPKSVGAKSAAFKNVVYRYDLPEAMKDGYIKEPAVGTRANFDPKLVDEDTLERIKLEDGIHYHEHVKVQLATYAKQNEKPLVHPFMLVVTQDTEHARRVREFVESDGFFEGRYKGRVAEIHSKLTGEESDENAQRLLNIEKSGDTDIVIHVNKLKEGWDVSNLFTIVPLRASASDILTEQTLGRGLRLPYGKRTGVDAVDTLTVIAHDRFNDLIEKAKDADGVIHTLKQVKIGEGGDVSAAKPVMVEAPSVIEQMLKQVVCAHDDEVAAEFAPEAKPYGMSDNPAPAFTFQKEEEVALAQTVLTDVLPSIKKQVATIRDLNDEKVVKRIVADAMAIQRSKGGLFSDLTKERAEEVVKEFCAAFVAKTIAIPSLTVTPQDHVSFGFQPFKLDLGSWNYQPLSRELLVQVLRTEKQTVISGEEGGDVPARLEDYLVAKLIDFDEIDYDAHAELLYDLAGQVVAHLRGYLKDEEEVRATLQGWSRDMAKAMFAQMRQNMWRTTTTYRVTLNAAFSELKPQAFDGSGKDAVRNFREPPERLGEIKRFIFTGFGPRACYAQAKFDSDTERKMAVLLERDPTVELWMKPGPNQFKIFDSEGHAYQPDFVVETETERLIIETKRRSDMNDADVRRKADAASLWCFIATEHHAKKHGDKPWRYVLVPDDAMLPNATVEGLLSQFVRAPDADLRGRYELSE